MNEHQPEWAKRSSPEKTVEEIVREFRESRNFVATRRKRRTAQQSSVPKEVQKGS